MSEEERVYYTFYYNDGTKKIYHFTREQMIHKMNSEVNVNFVLNGINTERYVWKAGMWTVQYEADYNTENGETK